MTAHENSSDHGGSASAADVGAEATRGDRHDPVSQSDGSTRVARPVPAHERLLVPTPVAGRAAPSAALEPAGTYQLCFEIASGGLATVYLAVHHGSEDFEKVVAIKKLLPELSKTPASVAMLVDEARISARANHPYVRDVFDLCRAADGTHFVVMEFLQGEPLSSVCKALARRGQGAFPVNHSQAVARVVANLCEGLHAVHELTRGPGADVVHRDVTPHNLFVLHDGSVRLTDLGIVQAAGRRQHTGRNTLKGKLAYMSPEYLSRAPYDRRSDIWAMGIVMWELLTGQRLFQGKHEAETLQAVFSGIITAPSQMRADVDARLDAIVLKALDRDMARRYRTAADFARALETYLQRQDDIVSSTEVASWLQELLPNSQAHLARLIELARSPEPHGQHDFPLSSHETVAPLAQSEARLTARHAGPLSGVQALGRAELLRAADAGATTVIIEPLPASRSVMGEGAAAARPSSPRWLALLLSVLALLVLLGLWGVLAA
ncbi:MAG TPA: serine/threonine-protein kinase [Polyangiaceae bacterium]